nr:hypothetical protein Iba_chr04aCG18490 [Ipomoea batatas]
MIDDRRTDNGVMTLFLLEQPWLVMAQLKLANRRSRLHGAHPIDVSGRLRPSTLLSSHQLLSSPSGKRHDQGVIGMEVAVTLGWAAPISTLFKAVYASKGYAEMAKTRRTRRTPANDLNFLIDPS